MIDDLVARSRRVGMRIALYSHDTMGLGHLRRNLCIAETLLRSNAHANALMISGVFSCGVFAMPRGVDCLTVPALFKRSDGFYQSRSLKLPLDELIALRRQIICRTLGNFQPDVLIVDGVPHGVEGELDQTLKHLQGGGRTRFVLGLRDVLDEPRALRKEWVRRGNEACVRDYYDRVWIYGDQSVYDAVEEYGWSSEVSSKVRYTGYLHRDVKDRSSGNGTGRNAVRELGLPPGRLALCLAGGGQDGGFLCAAFCRSRLPPDVNGVILTGPFIPPENKRELYACARSNERLRILEFHPKPALLLKQAHYVVAMGGYNTVCEILSLRKRALIVPRVSPRREQWIRAQRLHARGLVDFCHPAELTPDTIAAWLSREPELPPRADRCIDFNGLGRLSSLLDEVLALSPQDNEIENTRRVVAGS